MFILNPYYLLHASLLHWLMLQGVAILAYLIGRATFRLRQKELEWEYDQLLSELKAKLAANNGPVYEADIGTEDLKEILGVNVPVEQVLAKVGIYTFKQLSQTSPEKIRHILTEYGPLNSLFDPATWPAQAHLAATGRWTELRAWQAQLENGEY